MSAYTREEFNLYKGDKEFLTVDYEYPKGNWESIDHVSYEDYINTFDSYVDLHKKEKHKDSYKDNRFMRLAEEAGGARLADNIIQMTKDDLERFVYFVNEEAE